MNKNPHQTRKKRLDTARQLQVVLLLMLLTFVVGVTVGVRGGPRLPAVQDAPRPLAAVGYILGQPICLVPLVAFLSVLIPIGLLRGYYYVQRMNSEKRVWAAKATFEEAVALRQRQKVTDLSTNALGVPLPRLIQNAQGEVALVHPGIATRVVTPLDPTAAPDSEQLRAVALLGYAMAQSGHTSFPNSQGLGRYGGMPESLLLGVGSRMIPMEERVPQTITIVSPDELALATGPVPGPKLKA